MLRKILVMVMASLCALGAQQAPAGNRAVGVVQSVNGSQVTLKTDEGGTVVVTLGDGARVMRAAPGSTQPEKSDGSEIQSGDRLLAKGTPGADGKTFAATAVLLMKSGDVASRQKQELSAWQKGVSGVVSSVDAGSGEIKVRAGRSAVYTVKTSPSTEFLRYAPSSTAFKDASKSSFAAIKMGDQLRARGTKSADGSELTADEVISGTFRNIAATVSSVDAGQGKLTVQDLVAKRPVEIKVNGQTQAHVLPTMMANRIGMMLKGLPNGQAGGPGMPMRPRQSPAGEEAGGPPRFGGGAPDFQQMLNRTPVLNLSDVKKGDALLIVATEDGTAVALVGGVEPILTAAPGTEAVNLLSNWSLGAQPGEGGPQ